VQCAERVGVRTFGREGCIEGNMMMACEEESSLLVLSDFGEDSVADMFLEI